MAFLSRSELKIYIAAVAGLTVIALGITLIAMLPGFIRSRELEKQEAAKMIQEKKIDPGLFVVPEDYKDLIEDTWIPYRPARDRWTEEEIKPYWNDPVELTMEYLDKQNEKYVKDLFKDLP